MQRQWWFQEFVFGSARQELTIYCWRLPFRRTVAYKLTTGGGANEKFHLKIYAHFFLGGLMGTIVFAIGGAIAPPSAPLEPPLCSDHTLTSHSRGV